jgi:transposase
LALKLAQGSNHWAREFQKRGHTVKQIAPQFVKPYVKSNKNDAADAEAIAEAVTRPGMRFVAIKQVQHHDIQVVHRVRSRLVKHRTALINELHGLLMEYNGCVKFLQISFSDFQ